MYGSRRGLRSGAAASQASVAAESQPSQASTSNQLSSQLSQVNIAEDGSSENDEVEVEVEEYGDMHRLVLQGVMAAGYLDAKGVKKLFTEACKYVNCKVPVAEHTAPSFIQKVVREINDRIKVYDMMIRSATCEITGEKFYMYLITIEKQVMKFQTFFTKVELELFQKLLDAILKTNNDFTITMVQALNLAEGLDAHGFSKVNAEHFLERMMAMQYFVRVFKTEDMRDFDITLGFRTIREFEPVFREAYEDCFKNCCVCKMIMLNGLQCPKCPVVIHRGCLTKYLKDCKSCVSCKRPWRKKELLVRTRDGVGMAQPIRPLVPQASQNAETAGESGPSKRTRTAGPVGTGKPGEEVDMPILEPMVSPRSAGATIGQTQRTKLQKKKDSSTPSPGKKGAVKKTTTEAPAPTRTTRRNQILSESDSE